MALIGHDQVDTPLFEKRAGRLNHRRGIPGTLKEISQVIILDADDNTVEHIPIPTEIKTSSELAEMFRQRDVTLIEKAQIIAASGDEERVHGLFSEIKPDLPIMQRRMSEPNRKFLLPAK